MPNNWYVITGGPSSGKTTLLAELNKLGHATIPEAARTVIDQAVAKGIPAKKLRADEKLFQEDIARLKARIEAEHNKDLLTFFDRGMQDTIAYLRHYDFSVEKWVQELMRESSYRKVFLLDPLPTYRRDYARVENADFRQSIHKLLYSAYTEFGMEPISVPALGLPERVEFILDKVKLGQNA